MELPTKTSLARTVLLSVLLCLVVGTTVCWIAARPVQRWSLEGALQESAHDERAAHMRALMRQHAWIGQVMTGEGVDPSLLRTLLDALEHEEAFVRANAASGLGDIGRDKAVPGLVRAMDDGDPDVRRAAAHAVGKIANATRIKFVHDHRIYNYKHLGDVKGLTPECLAALPALIRCLEDQDAGVRRLATVALWSYGVEAVPAIPVLIKRLNDNDAEVRRVAAIAFENIPPYDGAIEALIRALREEDQSVKCAAADGLGQAGAKAQSAVPALLEALDDPDPLVRRCAARAILQVDPTAKSSVPAELLEDADGIEPSSESR